MSNQSTIVPDFWIDHKQRRWKTPTIKGRLKMKVPCHRALREFVIHRDGYKCVECGSTDILQLVADHILSRRNGGAHHPSNMQCLCNSCNSRKSGLVDSKVKALGGEK